MDKSEENAAVADGTPTPVDVNGAFAFPDPDKSKRNIRFIDSGYNTLFHIPDGGNLVIARFDGGERTYPCQYIDSHHVLIGTETLHICEFAEIMERNGSVYRPENPQKGDILDTYEIFQLDLSDKKASAYSFCPYEMAKGKIRPAHYQRMYAGVLAPKTTLEELYQKHNREMYYVMGKRKPLIHLDCGSSVADRLVSCQKGGESGLSGAIWQQSCGN